VRYRKMDRQFPRDAAAACKKASAVGSSLHPRPDGHLPTSGDMIGLGYIIIALITMVSILAATLVGFGVSWTLAKR
jgi:hypothetical protein